jgi:hypothetical protein
MNELRTPKESVGRRREFLGKAEENRDGLHEYSNVHPC